jgi:hypothetical protein
MLAKPPHVVTLDKDFAGVPAGARLLVSSPLEIDAFLREHTCPGEFLSIQELRRRLAGKHSTDAACPVSTSIFLRTVSEAAWDQIEAGTPTSLVTPFWRAVEPGSPLARKLRCGSEWLEHQRAAEVSTRRPRASRFQSEGGTQ